MLGREEDAPKRRMNYKMTKAMNEELEGGRDVYVAMYKVSY